MPSQLCAGFEEDGQIVTCVFSVTQSGKQATGHYDGKCVWCNPARMRAICSDACRKKRLVAYLRRMKNNNVCGFDKACLRVPEEDRADVIRESEKTLVKKRKRKMPLRAMKKALGAALSHVQPSPPVGDIADAVANMDTHNSDESDAGAKMIPALDALGSKVGDADVMNPLWTRVLGTQPKNDNKCRKRSCQREPLGEEALAKERAMLIALQNAGRKLNIHQGAAARPKKRRIRSKLDFDKVLELTAARAPEHIKMLTDRLGQAAEIFAGLWRELAAAMDRGQAVCADGRAAALTTVKRLAPEVKTAFKNAVSLYRHTRRLWKQSAPLCVALRAQGEPSLPNHELFDEWEKTLSVFVGRAPKLKDMRMQRGPPSRLREEAEDQDRSDGAEQPSTQEDEHYTGNVSKGRPRKGTVSEVAAAFRFGLREDACLRRAAAKAIEVPMISLPQPTLIRAQAAATHYGVDVDMQPYPHLAVALMDMAHQKAARTPVEVDMSQFPAHQRIAEVALAKAHKRSLALMDELFEQKIPQRMKSLRAMRRLSAMKLLDDSSDEVPQPEMPEWMRHVEPAAEFTETPQPHNVFPPNISAGVREGCERFERVPANTRTVVLKASAAALEKQKRDLETSKLLKRIAESSKPAIEDFTTRQPRTMDQEPPREPCRLFCTKAPAIYSNGFHAWLKRVGGDSSDDSDGAPVSPAAPRDSCGWHLVSAT